MSNLFTLPLGVIGQLCSVIVALPGYLDIFGPVVFQCNHPRIEELWNLCFNPLNSCLDVFFGPDMVARGYLINLETKSKSLDAKSGE